MVWRLSCLKRQTMKHSENTMLRILPMVLLLGLAACEDYAPLHNSGNYFPLDNHHEWSYQQRMENFNGDEIIYWWFDTLTLHVQGEVTEDGQIYKALTDADNQVNKLVRREGSKYFVRNHESYFGNFSDEYIFLDIDKAVGDSWSYIKDEGYSKTEYVIMAKNASHIILGVEYKDVIEVQVNYYHQTTNQGTYELWVSAVHYYAKGIGDVYHYYPYPISGRYGDASSFLINNKK